MTRNQCEKNAPPGLYTSVDYPENACLLIQNTKDTYGGHALLTPGASRLGVGICAARDCVIRVPIVLARLPQTPT